MKVWLITGSSRGLGRAIAEAVLRSGDCLLATARDTKSLNQLIERYGDRAATFPLDVTNAEAAGEAVGRAVSRFGGLDVLVNNAGYGTISPIEDTSIEEFRAQIDTNLLGTIYTTGARSRSCASRARAISFNSLRSAAGPARWGAQSTPPRNGALKASPKFWRKR